MLNFSSGMVLKKIPNNFPISSRYFSKVERVLMNKNMINTIEDLQLQRSCWPSLNENFKCIPLVANAKLQLKIYLKLTPIFVYKIWSESLYI